MQQEGPIIIGEDKELTQGTNELNGPTASGNIIPEDFLSKLNPQAREFLQEETLRKNRELLRNEIIEKGKTALDDSDKTMFKAPITSCSTCYGTGRNGWHSYTGEVNICNCMRRGKLLDSSPDDFITVGDFMKIFLIPKPTYTRNHIRPKSIRREVSKNRKLAKKNRNSGNKNEMVC